MKGAHARNNESGIALVIVLGMLAVLMLISVAFSVLMRTEMESARNAAHIDYAKDLSLAVLDHALLDFDDLLDGGVAIPGAFRDQTFFFNLDDTGERAESVVTTNLPGQLYDVVGVPRNTEMYWTALEPRDDGLAKGQVGGLYYAYILIPEMDRIDINALTNHPVTNFYGPAINYENAFEMWTNRYRVFTTAEMNRDFREGRQYAHYSVFSRYTQAYIDEPADIASHEHTPRVPIAGTRAELEDPVRAQAIQERLTEAGLDAAFVYNNLLNYVAPDRANPPGLSAFNSLAVPMFNEVAIVSVNDAVLIDPDDDIWAVDFDVAIDVWYPFDRPMPPDDALAVVVDVTSPNADVSCSQRTPPNPAQIAGLEPDNAFLRIDTTWRAEIEGVGNLGSFDVVVDLTHPLDAVAQGTLLFSISAAPGVGTSVLPATWQVDDPRRNFDAQEWQQGAMATFGQLNPGPAAVELATPWLLPLHAAERPLNHVGELCFIASDPGPAGSWSYVDIVDTHARVLDYFTVYTNRYVHGLVNVNSRKEEVLVAALYNTNTLFDISATFTLAEAEALAAEIKASADNAPFVMRSELGRLPRLQADPRILAGSSDHLDVYGNSFTLLLLVKAGREPLFLDENDFNYAGLSEYVSDLTYPSQPPNIAPSEVPLDPWGQPYMYSTGADGRAFELRSAGRDRRFNTENDIVITR